MAVIINGDTGIDKITDGSVVQADLAGGGLYPKVPAFSAYTTSTSSISNATWTKVPANIEEFDTNSNYDNTTNYRFTPNVAGYYQVNGQAQSNGTVTRILTEVRKNGTAVKTGVDQLTNGNRSVISCLIYMNGSTDYLEWWVYVTGSSLAFNGGSGGNDSYFQAHLVSV